MKIVNITKNVELNTCRPVYYCLILYVSLLSLIFKLAIKTDNYVQEVFFEFWMHEVFRFFIVFYFS